MAAQATRKLEMKAVKQLNGMVKGAAFSEEAFEPGKVSPDWGFFERSPIQRQENMLDDVFRSLLGLLFEDYNTAKEETEKLSFPTQRNSTFHHYFVFVEVSLLLLAVSSLRAGAMPFISESLAPGPGTDTQLQ